MGYVDADTHVLESQRAWEYFDPSDREFAPVPITTDDGTRRHWLVGDQVLNRGAQFSHIRTVDLGARDLSDVTGRLQWMDKLGVDFQILFPSFFLGAIIKRPEVELALAKSYNRWLADVSHESKGRIRWAAIPSLSNMDATLAMLPEAKAGGAVSVLLRPIEKTRILADRFFFPLYAKAAELDLAITVHVGTCFPELSVFSPGGAAVFATTPMIGTFYNLLVSDVSERFPSLRFGFLEGASNWIGFALHRATRTDASSQLRKAELPPDVLARKHFFVACMVDEDLPYIVSLAGPGVLVHGTDFGHTDVSTEIEGHRLLCERADIPANIAARITDRNARDLYGLPR